MKGPVWRGSAAILLLCLSMGMAHGQELRAGAVGASSSIAKGQKFGMRSLVGQAAAGIPVSSNFRHGVGFWFADTGIKIPNSTEETEDFSDPLPVKFELHQNYPNPFNPSTTIAYALPLATHVTVDVFNILGQKMVSLVDEVQEAGSHKVVWNATDNTGGQVSSGVYIYRIVADRFVQTRTMALVK